MKKNIKNSIIFIIATLAIATFAISCQVSGTVTIPVELPDLTPIWDYLGFNKPSNLQAMAISDTQIFMTWDDKVSGEDGFKIEVSIDGGDYTYLATVTANTASYFHKNLSGSTFYSYRVYAYDSTGNSEYSNVAFTLTLAPPSAPPDDPTNLQAVALSDTAIELEWVDNSSNEDGFKIKISQDGSNFSDLGTADANATSYTSTGLTPETTYYYKVIAFNSFGDSGETDPANATTTATPLAPPNAPTNLQALTVSDMQIDLSWTDNSDNDAGFAIEISSDGSSFALLDNVKTNVTSYESSSLMPETTYYYRVYASNSAGNSGYSNIASATTNAITDTVPDAPTNLQAKAASDTQIELGWTDNSDNEDGFNVEISKNGLDFSWVGKVKANVTGYSVTGLSPNYTYYFRVNGYNFYGSSVYSNLAKATTLPAPTGVPAKPTNLQAKAASDTMIDIAWTDNSGDEDGFNIEVSEDGIKFQWIDKVGSNVTGYSLGGLRPELTLWFRVNAFNRYGSSKYTDPASATTNPKPGAPPAAPTSLVAKVLSDTQIALGWMDNSINEDGFNIEYGIDGTNFKWIASVKPDVREYLVEGLKPNYTFYFRVNAFNREGSSGYSNTAKATTNPTPGEKPAAPTNLAAIALSDTSIELRWEDRSNNEDLFNIEISENGVEFKWIAEVKPNITTYVSTGLRPSTLYYYRVNAYNSYGYSDYSNTVEIKTQGAIEQPPTTPKGLIATPISDTQIEIVWDDVSDNEEGFNIYRALDDGITKPVYGFVKSVGQNVTSFGDEGLRSKTKYWYRVNAFNKAGTSGYSNEDYAVTLEPAQTKPDSPVNLKAEAISESQIDLGWEDKSNNEDGFYVYRSDDGGETYSDIAKLKPNTTSYSDTGLSHSTTYYYGVAAFNDIGSSESNVAFATTKEPQVQKPAAPSGLEPDVVTSSQIDLYWTDNATNEDGFKIYYKKGTDPLIRFSYYGAVKPSLGSGLTVKASVTNLTAETTYSFYVSAYNAAGSANSSTVTATTPVKPTPPAAPSDLSASAYSSSQIDLSWTDNAANEDGFKIYYKPSTEEKYGLYGSVGLSAGSGLTVKASVKGLAASTKYDFYVSAYNTTGSADSSVVTAVTKDPPLEKPSSPTNLEGSYNIFLRYVSLSWEHDGVNVTGFIILGSATGGKDPREWKELMRVEGRERAARVTNLISETGDYYMVVAYNNAGETWAERPIYVAYGK